MTLVEVVIAMTVLAIAMGGIFATLLQSRRLTEGSVVQASALTIVQGYVEQMKSLEILELVGGTTDIYGKPVLTTTSYAIPTRSDSTTLDPLMTSTGTPPDLSTIVPGVTPNGVVDNLKNFDIAKDISEAEKSSTSVATPVAWSSVWPKAKNYPSGTVGSSDLKINLWVWITDLSGTSILSSKAYGITVIYTWQYNDGRKAKYNIGTIRSIRSSVPTF
jgi:Tfp pilus assembly protein PilV